MNITLTYINRYVINYVTIKIIIISTSLNLSAYNVHLISETERIINDEIMYKFKNKKSMRIIKIRILQSQMINELNNYD